MERREAWSVVEKNTFVPKTRKRILLRKMYGLGNGFWESELAKN
jgi:hypothetical protein